MSKSICGHGDPIRLAVPGSHQFGPGLDPSRQLKSTSGIGRSGLHHLVKQPSDRRGKAAVGLLLNRVSNAATEEVRTERLGRFGPEYLAVAFPQVGDGHSLQPIQLCLNRRISQRRSVLEFHDAALDLPIRYVRLPSTF